MPEGTTTTTAANTEPVRRLYGGLMAKGDTAVAEEVPAETTSTTTSLTSAKAAGRS